MGPTGVGKSTFISEAIGRESGIGHGLESQTCEIKAFRVTFSDGVNVVLVDTPGFDDTYTSDLEVLRKISSWLKKTCEKGFKLSGLLYLHPISANRMENSPLKNLKMFQKLCGDEALSKVILTTTMWSRVDRTIGIAREKELKREFWADMIKKGSRVARFEGTQQSAWSILDSLVSFASQKIQIQRELVDLRRDLPNTEAGRELHGYIENLIEKQQNLLNRMSRNLAGASDQEVKEELLEEIKRFQEEREKAMQNLRQLQPSLFAQIHRFFSRSR